MATVTPVADPLGDSAHRGGDWWLAKLGEGTREEFDYTPEVEGRLPAGLTGTLYRNGPGLYERAGFKKWNLLDGDGMIRATSFAEGAARFRTRFVRTRKFEAEETAGRFRFPTLTGTRGQVKQELHVLVKDRTGRHKAQAVLPSPRSEAYFHDFFWARPYAVFRLQPALLSPLPMVLGFRSFTDSLRWTPSAGSLLVVVDTTGKRAPLTLEAPAVWMWHSLNAYVAGDRILADFVGYDAPDHFLGPDAAFRTIMQGRPGLAKAPGMLRRFTIDLAARRAGMETVAEGHFEFPMPHPGRVGRKHRYGYVAQGDIAHDWYQTGVARIDVESGSRSEFSFGADCYVGEPIFAPHPAAAADPAATEDRGWILSEVLDGKTGKSFLAVFDAAHLEDGPVAKVKLRTHLPMSFHGWWEAA